MSAAGVGRLSRSATSVVARAVSGFHLLLIDGYSQAKAVLPGQKFSSMGFTVGSEPWRMDYYPNGRDASARSNSNHASVYVQITEDRTRRPVRAWYKFSLLDHAGNTAYEIPAETGPFTGIPEPEVDDHYSHPLYFPRPRMRAFRSPAAAGDEQGPGCGHEEFIGREELEHLIRNDFLVVRCDVGLTQMTRSHLAGDEINNWEDEEDEDYFGAPPSSPPRRRRRRRQPDDSEYVKWCLAQRPGESRIRQGRKAGHHHRYA